MTTKLKTSSPTIGADNFLARVRDLRAEAAEAGDDATVADCETVLESDWQTATGVWNAAVRCAEVMNSAAAMDDDDAIERAARAAYSPTPMAFLNDYYTAPSDDLVEAARKAAKHPVVADAFKRLVTASMALEDNEATVEEVAHVLIALLTTPARMALRLPRDGRG